MSTPTGYEYSVDWFSPNIPVWKQLLPQVKPRRILEIGSYEGRSACFFIEQCAAEAPLELHCIDSWEGGIEHQKGAIAEAVMSDVERRFDANTLFAASQVPHEVKLVKHKTLSHPALAKLIASGEKSSFDLIYIDGSHQAPDVLADAVLAFPLLRVGGLMAFDDYLWHIEPLGRQDPLNMPKPGIDAFLNTYQRKMRVVPGAPLGQIYANKIFE